MAVLQRQIVIHPANTRMLNAQDVKPGMVITEGVVLGVYVKVNGKVEFDTVASNLTVIADHNQQICVFATVDEDVLEAIRLAM